MDHAVHPLVQKVKLLVLNGGSIPGFQIGGVQLKDTEAHVQRGLVLIHGDLDVFFQNFLSGPSDSLLADLADILVPGLVRRALFVAQFGNLHLDKAPVAAVLGIKLHHCMGCGSGAGEEVENGVVCIRYMGN